MEYLAFAVTLVSSNPYFRPSTGSRTSFSLVLICTDELVSTPNIIALLLLSFELFTHLNFEKRLLFAVIRRLIFSFNIHLNCHSTIVS